MASSGSESTGSGSDDGIYWELAAYSDEREIAVRLTVRRSRVKTRAPPSQLPRCGSSSGAASGGSSRRRVSALSTQPPPRWWVLVPAPTSVSESEANDRNAHGRGCGSCSEVEARHARLERAKARRISCLSAAVPVPFGSDEDPVVHAVKQRSMTSKESDAHRHRHRRINANTLAEGIEESRRAAKKKDAEEARAQILVKQQARTARALAKDQARAVRALAGLPPKQDENMTGTASDTSSSSGYPYVAFDRYFRDKDDKGKGKDSCR